MYKNLHKIFPNLAAILKMSMTLQKTIGNLKEFMKYKLNSKSSQLSFNHVKD